MSNQALFVKPKPKPLLKGARSGKLPSLQQVRIVGSTPGGGGGSSDPTPYYFATGVAYGAGGDPAPCWAARWSWWLRLACCA